MKIDRPSKLKEELARLTKEQIIEVIKKNYTSINDAPQKTKEELIEIIIKDYEFKKFWSEYYDHDYDFEL